MLLEVVMIAISLSMDAIAVSICKGLSMTKISIKNILIIGLYFGLFQAIMPLLGYYLGNSFEALVSSVDHYIICLLLSLTGFSMIKDAFKQTDNQNDKVNFKEMIILAIATSIDAFAIGITFALLDINIIVSICIIGIITFILSIIAVYLGYKFNNISSQKASIVGGITLILIGLKILLEHLKII